jgi:hypothetical protein
LIAFIMFDGEEAPDKAGLPTDAQASQVVMAQPQGSAVASGQRERS